MRHLRYFLFIVAVMGIGALSVHSFLRVYSQNNGTSNMLAKGTVNPVEKGTVNLVAQGTADAKRYSASNTTNNSASNTTNNSASNTTNNSTPNSVDNKTTVSAFTHAQDTVITIFAGDSNLYINGSSLPLHPQKTIPAKWVNNSLLVSPYTVLELLGATYQYQAAQKRLDIDFSGKLFTFIAGSPIIQIDNQQKMMPVISLIEQQEILIPIIYVIQAMNPSIDATKKSITLTKKGKIEGVQRLQELYQTVPTIQRYSQIPFALHQMERSF